MPVKRKPVAPETEPTPAASVPVTASPLATIPEAAEYLKTSVHSIRQLEKLGEIRRVPRRGKAFVFFYSELDRYLADLMKQAA
jgi:excisionase family DNA binding protein